MNLFPKTIILLQILLLPGITHTAAEKSAAPGSSHIATTADSGGNKKVNTRSPNRGSAKNKRREPTDYFRLYDHDLADSYLEISRRHVLLFSAPTNLQANKEILLDAAEQILNPKSPSKVGKEGGNHGGGAMAFLLVDNSDPKNAYIMKRCSIPTKTTKSAILRIAQFPSSSPLQIFKPVGKYKSTASYIENFLSEVRKSGPGATRALMSETKVKTFRDIDTSATVLRAVGSTINFLVKRPDDVILFSYLPNCTHCKAFNQTFFKVRETNDKPTNQACLRHSFLSNASSSHEFISCSKFLRRSLKNATTCTVVSNLSIWTPQQMNTIS